MLLALSVLGPLSVDLGPVAYKVFDQRGGSIGRVDGNDWTLPDAERLVSMRHANVAFADGAWCLTDCSTNGTFINRPDQAVSREQPVRLQDGDRLFIGNYEILVQLIDVDAPAPEPANDELLDAPEPPPHEERASSWRESSVEEPAAPRRESPLDERASSWRESSLEESPLPRREPAQPRHETHHGATSPEDLFAALGIDPSQVPPDLYHTLGSILRTVVRGTIEVLQARAQVKSQFHMSATMIRPVENNPLKFARTPEDALQSLFGAQNPGYLPPAEAFRDAFEDIALHQVAVLAGVRAAYDSMLAAFRPDRLEAQYERRLQRASFIRLYGPLRYWALYRAQFEEIDADPEAHFQRLFGEEFAKAYTDQLQSLQTAARSSNRQVRT